MIFIYYSTYLAHHGVKGQKWGVRRYQNPDGTLTEAGKKRQAKNVASNKKATITKGTSLYRISTNKTSDTSNKKIYVSASKKSGDFYITELGANKIYRTGKAFAHEYIAKTDLKMPDKKTMEKIELGLLNDKQIQKELIDSLMKKGYSREKATNEVKPYNKGKAFVQRIGNIAAGAYIGAILGADVGAPAGAIAGPVGLIGGIGSGAIAGGVFGAKQTTNEKRRALGVARVSYGDVNNKEINAKLQKKLSDKGYNAMKDYNDRRAYGKKGEHAVIIFDSKNNIKFKGSKEVKSKEFGEAYARNYLEVNKKTKLDYNDLVKDGEKRYKDLYEKGVIERMRVEENKRLLELNKENEKRKKIG